MKKTIASIVAALFFLLLSSFTQADEQRDHICFRVLDANGDGVVTLNEFERHYGKSEEKFNSADTDRDGQLTHDEYHVSLGHGAS